MADAPDPTTPGPSMTALGWTQAASTFIQILGLREQGKAAKLAGERDKYMAEFNAWNAERAAGDILAANQRRAIEERRVSDVEASRMLAVAAASGGGVSDPTIVRLISRTQGEGVYRASIALYEGEARARQLRLDAATGRISGLDAMEEGLTRQAGANLVGLGVAIKGAGSLYAKYGLGGPSNLRSGAGDAALIDAGTPTTPSQV